LSADNNRRFSALVGQEGQRIGSGDPPAAGADLPRLRRTPWYVNGIRQPAIVSSHADEGLVGTLTAAVGNLGERRIDDPASPQARGAGKDGTPVQRRLGTIPAGAGSSVSGA
jgi:hypothetical protein